MCSEDFVIMPMPWFPDPRLGPLLLPASPPLPIKETCSGDKSNSIRLTIKHLDQLTLCCIALVLAIVNYTSEYL